MNPQPDQFDHLLDQALANYTPSEARPYLERRVRAGVQAGVQAAFNPKPISPFRLRIWIFAVPLTAVAILIGFLTFWHFSNHLQETNQAVTTQSPSHAIPNTQREKLSPSAPFAQNHPRPQGRTNPPRPTPPPRPATSLDLTEQERQLFQLAALHTGAAQSILNLQANRDQPLRDEPLKVKPIQFETLRWNAIPVQHLEIPPIEMATRQPPTQPSTF